MKLAPGSHGRNEEDCSEELHCEADVLLCVGCFCAAPMLVSCRLVQGQQWRFAAKAAQLVEKNVLLHSSTALQTCIE